MTTPNRDNPDEAGRSGGRSDSPSDESVPSPDDLPGTAAGSVGHAGAAAGPKADASGTIQSGKLAGRTMWGAIWILAMPVLLQQTMQACVGLADKIFAGRLPQEMIRPGLDAVGVGSYIGWFVAIAMAGLGIGGQAIIARAMGGGRSEEAQTALGEAISLSLIWGALVGVVLWFGVIPLATMTGLTEEATGYLYEYVRTIAVAMPFCGVMMVGSMCLHGAGETVKPSMIAIGVNLLNIVFSWFFSGVDLQFNGVVLENPSPFNLNVLGIALGTAVSYLFGAIFTIYVLRRGVKDLKLEVAELALSSSMSYRIVRIGVPNFMEGIAMWGVNLFILMFIGWIEVSHNTGGGLQGAHVIAVQWEAFSFLPGFAIGIAAGALAGQYLGAGNPAMARKAIMACTMIGAIMMTSLGIVFIVAAEFLTRLISTDPIHLAETPSLLRICGAVQIFFALTMVVRQGLRGVGDTRWTFIITTVSSYGVRLPAAYLFGITFDMGLFGIWIALCGEMVIRAMLFLARFLHGGWQRIKV
ncbi:MAG: MATE family efflux transporter [Phycisphaerales bacterium]|nr:MAG: MATE family efflux transporter [Phycisphaerales bacterium]